MTSARPFRCAIYTRVSSDQGLEQDFNSLQAQREAAEAYIKSQAHEGWRLRRDHYDDGGFSGGSMERPALRELLADIAERRIDIVVVYKVDRLTRSLADFAKLVELFDSKSVSFVSVTQSFNTTSSMGRLTLNVLLSFAQFEREVTGERIRDKIAASKKKGIWMGGTVPLGYRVVDRKLLIDEDEAKTVEFIFQRYLDLGSLPALQRDLLDRGVRTRLRTRASGATIGGVPLTNGPLAHLLRNRMYLGEINHGDASYKGEHPAIVPIALFETVQVKLTHNRNRSDLRSSRTDALLTGRLFDDHSNLMSPTYTMKKGVQYRYYVSAPAIQGRKMGSGTIARVPAKQIEALVQEALELHLSGDQRWSSAPSELFKAIDLRVSIHNRALEITWRDDKASNANLVTGASVSAGTDVQLDPGSSDNTDSIDRQRLIVTYDVATQRRRREVILPVDAPDHVRPIRASVQQNLICTIAQSKAWLQEVTAGTSISTIASRERKTERMTRMLLSLAFLDPKLVRAALQGTLPSGVSVRRLIDAPISWHEQWRSIGLCRPA